MMTPRPETRLLEAAYASAMREGKGGTLFVVGEPGIGKSTLVSTFLDRCDQREGLNVLTATGRCIDIDGISRGYLPWKEILVELDADRAAGNDIEKKKAFTNIVKTLFDESGSQWIQNVPYVGEISSAILDTAQAIQRVEKIDVKSGEARELSFRERLTHVVRECTGSWMGAVPVVGGLAEAIYKTSKSLAEQHRGTAMRSQEDFFLLVMTRLRALARENPVVLFLDDLQWADASSLSLLLYLAKNLHDQPYPLLLVGSYRDEDVNRGRRNPTTGEWERHPLEEKLNVLRRYGACEELRLSPFDRAAIESYLQERFGRHAFGRSFVDELERVSGGNALFLQEMLTNMIERGIVAERDGVSVVIAEPDYHQLPMTVEGVIRERYERLADELKEMIQVAAVEGEEFSFEVLAVILRENRLDLNRRIEQLTKNHAIVHRSERLSERVMRLYVFTHNLVQKYVYYSIDGDFRRDIHTMIATALLEVLGEEGVERWAREYSLHLGVGEGIIDEHRQITLDSPPTTAGERDVVDRYLHLQRVLLDQHLDAYNNEEALAVCNHLLALFQVANDDDDAARLEVLKKKGNVLELVGDWTEAEGLYNEQLQMVRAREDRLGETAVLAALADVIRRLGRLEEAEEIARRGEKIAREIADRSAIARAVGYRGLLHWRRGELEEALECFAEQEEIAREIDDADALGMALGNLGSLFSSLGDYDEALRYYGDSERIARERGDRIGVASTIGNRGTIHLERGEFEEALASFREEEEIEREIGYRKGIARAVGNRGTIHLERGEFEEALACFRDAEAEHREIGFLYNVTSWLSETAWTLVEVTTEKDAIPSWLPAYVPGLAEGADHEGSDWVEMTLSHAEHVARECLEISEGLSKSSTIFKSRLLLARIRALRGEVDEATTDLRSLLEETDQRDDEPLWKKIDRAEICYWLWKVTGKNDPDRLEADRLFRELNEKMPSFAFGKRIEQLSGDH